ncbi:hypothetical protein EBR66_02235 [bacterium]|nr:hypothetical protein [bacterium]
MQIPPVIFTTEKIGEVTSKTGEVFSVFLGLSREWANELKKKSLDESDVEIQNNTSDRERFGLGSYEEWYAKDRTPFALISKSGGLAGLAWFGPKSLGRKSLKHLNDDERAEFEKKDVGAGNWHTIVYRSYLPYRGMGLMKPFARLCMSAYRDAFPKARFWAGIHNQNPTSEGLAKSLGFIVDEEHSDRAQHHLVMVESSPWHE